MKKIIWLVAFAIAIAALGSISMLNSGSPSAKAAVIYKSPTCGCCVLYAAYLKERGYKVDIISVADMKTIKDQYGIPEEQWSCHTAVFGEYFIEGHMPLEVIEKLMSDHAEVDGLSLPGMPSGSPGMPGSKTEEWVISSHKNGRMMEHMRL